MASFEAQKSAPNIPSIESKVQVAGQYKGKGNDCFKEGAYKKAMIEYSKALAYTKGLPGRQNGLDSMSQMAMKNISDGSETISPEMAAKVDELDVVLKTNIATCCLKLNEPAKALEHIREALILNPKAWKSLLRKAEATMILKDLDKAQTILNEALANAPDEQSRTAVERMRERLAKQEKVENAKAKKAFGNIFAKAAKEEREEELLLQKQAERQTQSQPPLAPPAPRSHVHAQTQPNEPQKPKQKQKEKLKKQQQQQQQQQQPHWCCCLVWVPFVRKW
mmetsp:Transcript_7236/g.12152  ORF Transcript_7236/g.12152 Transcript_7236/m.12152 type:complete len:279 (+) Transcript_7236:47-883(+)